MLHNSASCVCNLKAGADTIYLGVGVYSVFHNIVIMARFDIMTFNYDIVVSKFFLLPHVNLNPKGKLSHNSIIISNTSMFNATIMG